LTLQDSQDSKTQLEERLKQLFNVTVLNNPWIPLLHRLPRIDGKGLSPKQAEFLANWSLEGGYGGAAGGGKSDALLMAALQGVNYAGYNAIIFRKTYPDLALPGAIMDRALAWLSPYVQQKSVAWDDSEKVFTFPSTARLAFGYMKTEIDKYRYQSAEFQFIGFDEATQFPGSQYRYMFSRLRRLQGVDIPLRMRSATNPGGIGHEWYRQRFIEEVSREGRFFVFAKLDDNRNLDRAEYVKSLSQLDPVTRDQLLNGNWQATGGYKFKRAWFQIVDEAPKTAKRCRYWDMASTSPIQGGDPDYTSGALLALDDSGIIYIEDVKHFRGTPQENEDVVRQTAILDREAHGNVETIMEMEPGSAGVSIIDYYARKVLLGFNFKGERATGDKDSRASPLSSAVEAKNVKLVRGSWINAFLDEAEAFPYGAHDDQIDACSGAFNRLTIIRRSQRLVFFGDVDK